MPISTDSDANVFPSVRGQSGFFRNRIPNNCAVTYYFYQNSFCCSSLRFRSFCRNYFRFCELAIRAANCEVEVCKLPLQVQIEDGIMNEKIKAIDFMYYVATPEFMEQWERAKEGELICRMEKAIGGLPRFVSIEEMIRQMDEAGVEKVFITQCKMWSYWRKWMYMDTRLEDVLQYTERCPDRFVGLAGYNPFRIKESLKEIELAVTKHGFKGVYVHIYGFDIPLNDAKMYPLFAKCVELDVPVSMQVGHVLEAMPSDGARPMFLDRIACDFPDLKMIGAHTGWPWVDELISVCYKWEKIWFGVDAWLPKYLSPQIVQFMNSRLGRDRCLWGTNGLPWKESLRQLCDLDLKAEVQRKVLRENAIELFKLNEPAKQPSIVETIPQVATVPLNTVS